MSPWILRMMMPNFPSVDFIVLSTTITNASCPARQLTIAEEASAVGLRRVADVSMILLVRHRMTCSGEHSSVLLAGECRLSAPPWSWDAKCECLHSFFRSSFSTTEERSAFASFSSIRSLTFQVHPCWWTLLDIARPRM